jgi:hypothetical protein
MTNPMDRSLDDMRNEKEVDAMVVEEAELEELEQLGVRLGQAYELSGEPPSLAAIEFAQSSVSLPGRTSADMARFNAAVRQRIDNALRASTGAPSIGTWVQHARQYASIDEAGAARETGVAVAAYRQFEAGRMPVWRLPAKTFATFCRELALDVSTLLRWASVSALSARHTAYGRVDTHDEDRSKHLDALARESELQFKAEFDVWRRDFIAAYEGPLAGDVRPQR